MGWGLRSEIGPALQRPNIRVHSCGASAQHVCPRRVVIVVWAWALARPTIVAAMDVATVRAAILLILVGGVGILLDLYPSRREWLISVEFCVWLEDVGVMLHLAPGLLLSVSSDSAAFVSTSVAVLLASLALLLFELHRLLTL